MRQQPSRKLLPAVLALLIALPGLAAAAPRRSENVCVVNLNYPGGTPLNYFIFQNVQPLAPGGAIPLYGIYFNGSHRVEPFSGSAVMASDGSVRLGIFVHSSAASGAAFNNDFTLSGVTDASFAGVLNYDNDGDFLPNGALPVESADCNSISIP